MNDIVVECNTDNDTLQQQIAQNSRLKLPWVKMVPPHEEHAVIVGSGPSVADCLDSIKWRQSLGQKIFALNGSAKYLFENGITVDYTVMVDAREENKFFIGWADKYLLSAQCHPSTFDIAGDQAILWQPYIPDLAGTEPVVDFEYSQIGGGTTVGLSAMCLVYTLGYRFLHLYGYDSSYRESKGHAFKQSLNVNDSCCYVTLDNVRYKCSIAMAKQAELFPILANDLIDKGCIITVDGDGLLPAVVRRQPPIPEPEMFPDEKSKYEAMWEHAAYRQVSPGELTAQVFIDVVKPIAGYRIVDYGCGTGRGSKAIRELSNCEVIQVDFADNCRDRDCKDFSFLVCDMTKQIPILADYGYCTDVMEHIEPENVDIVIENIMASCGKCFFQISTVPDVCGELIGQQLHLTVQPYEWWMETFNRLGFNVDFSLKHDIYSMFYLTT